MKILIDSDMVRVPSNCHECFCGYGGFCAVAPSETDGLCADEDKPEWCPITAQEPRVMTLEEYEAWIDTPFTERNPVFHEERTRRGTVTCWVNTVVCTLREYGKNDRCWTSRPDEKRREKEPWNA